MAAFEFRTDRRRILGLLAAPQLAAAQPIGSTLRVGPGERLRSLHDALREAQCGDTVELAAGDYHGDVAVVTQARLTLRGLGPGAAFHADGHDAQGKAILVVQGDDVTVENFEFRGARVPDGNGAGIRFERGRLLVRRCRFFDNEMGLLAANDPRQELTVEDCQFGQAPRHKGLLHHLLYVGAIGRLTLRGTRLGGGWRGHLVKTRALFNRIEYNRIDDGPDGEASYELEFPNGGSNQVVGNLIVQSPRSQNPSMLSMGAEARDGMRGRLQLAHNTFVNLGGDEARFIDVWTRRLQAAVELKFADNLFAGPGDPGVARDLWDVAALGNRRIALSELRDIARGDDRLGTGSALLGRAQPLPAELTPNCQFDEPAGTRNLPAGLRLSPGALQIASDDRSDRKR